jgi:hypothetical protein
MEVRLAAGKGRKFCMAGQGYLTAKQQETEGIITGTKPTDSGPWVITPRELLTHGPLSVGFVWSSAGEFAL